MDEANFNRDGNLYNMQFVLDRCLKLAPARLIVVKPYDDATMKSVSIAAQNSIVFPLLVGEKRRVKETAARFGIDPALYAVVDAEEDTLLERAASLFRDGEADFIMKGMVGTASFMHVLLDPRWQVRTENLWSHVGMLEIPETKRIFLMSDGAINILPNFSRKMLIIRNAVEVARKIGIPRIRVAMLAAVEKVKLPAMPATLDAFLMNEFSKTGFFGDCEIDGPFALDNAIDPGKADTKGIVGTVAGRSNVLIVPNVETGNVIWKTITCLQKRPAAGVVVGGRCPIVVPSRSDDYSTKLLSIQFARLLL